MLTIPRTPSSYRFIASTFRAEREEVNSRNRILKRKQQKSDRKWNPRQKKRRKGLGLLNILNL